MNLNKIKEKNKKKIAFAFSVLFLSFFLFFSGAQGVDAAWWDAAVVTVEKMVLMLVGGFLQIIVGVVGLLAMVVVQALIYIASYNNYAHEASVIMAWGVVRDFCNMFFILILLVIAFATILRIESYNMKRWLPKLLMMAVLINFSKTIASLIIDVSQIFMLTFVSAIGTTGGAIISALGVQGYFDIVRTQITENSKSPNLLSTIIGLIMGTIFLIIATIVLIVFLGALVIRMVMLWVYTVLSPLAFLLAAFPGGQSYSSRWWSEFTKNVISGPVLMFFFWLGLIAANGYTPSTEVTSQCFGPVSSLCPDNFLHFIIAIGMLVGGLIVTSQIGGAAGGLAGKGMGAINKGKALALRPGQKAGAWAGRKAKSGALATGRAGLGLASGFDRVAGAKLGLEGGALSTASRSALNTITFQGRREKWRKNREDKMDVYNNQRDINRVEAMSENNDEERKAKEEAARNITTKEGGKEFTYDLASKKFVRKDKDGNIIEDKEVQKMSERKMRMLEGYSSAHSVANATKKAAEEESVEKKSNEYAQSGKSSQELYRMLSDGSLSSRDKKAVALALGKDADHIGSMSRQQVKEVRDILGQNKGLQDKFDEPMLKKYAHKIYNIKEDVGKQKYIKALKSGKIDDHLHESALEDANVHKIIRSASQAKYERMMKNAKEDTSTRDAAKKGLKEAFNTSDNSLINGVIDPFRQHFSNMSDSIGEALEGVVDPNIIRSSVEQIVQNASTSDIASLNHSNFNTQAASRLFNGDSVLIDEFRDSFDQNMMSRLDQREMSRLRSAEGLRDYRDFERLHNARNASTSGGQNQSNNPPTIPGYQSNQHQP
ncbi:hypothetical protein C0584_01420 [Candidatus Parcubacteria bacterium]|nr:MAG: hypothetical protein C0584_01420 [Candidatus Parcubacteria bacterium]